jgi:probable HAF family extracellular repeat protein
LSGAGCEARAEALLQRVRQRHPADVGVNIDLAEIARRAKPPRLDEVVRYCSVVALLRPDSPGARTNLGLALQKQGKLDEAINELREAVRLNPNHATIHHDLGSLLVEKNQSAEAVDEFRKAIRLQPNNPFFHCNVGVALLKQQEREEAAGEFREAIRLRPDHAPAHHGLGCAFGELGKLDEAIAAYRKAIAIAPRSAGMHSDVGKALALQEKFEEAIAEFREAIGIDPKYFGVHDNLASALVCQGKLEEAISEYRAELRLHPNCYEAHVGLIYALLKLGKPDEAIASCRESTRLGLRAWAQGVLTETETKKFAREDLRLHSWRFPRCLDGVSIFLVPTERWRVMKSRFCTAVLVLGVLASTQDAQAQTQQYQIKDLGALGSDANLSRACSINNQVPAQVVGYSYVDETTFHAFLWDGSMRDLGTLGGSNSAPQPDSINALSNLRSCSDTSKRVSPMISSPSAESRACESSAVARSVLPASAAYTRPVGQQPPSQRRLVPRNPGSTRPRQGVSTGVAYPRTARRRHAVQNAPRNADALGEPGLGESLQ